MRVVLFLDSTGDSSVERGNEICKILSSDFAMTNVVLRSAKAPVDILSAAESDVPTLWVFWQSPPDGLMACTIFPILSLPNNGNAKMMALRIAKFCGLASAETRKLVAKAASKMRQEQMVQDAQVRTKSLSYMQSIRYCFEHNLQLTKRVENVGSFRRGKVRDSYATKDHRLVLVTTDRQSGFDRQLAVVPFKGAVLNLTSAYWFEQTKHIVSNHLLSVPHPNMSVVRKCKPFPIEFVVRSYMTGSTSTSIWKNYQNGVRDYCGHSLPEGMKKNQKLWANILTPTTKEEEHDRPISSADIVKEGWMTPEDLEVCSDAAMAVFSLGQKLASSRGLILVDTKYEFGRDEQTGHIFLIDEVHTPDSSRYWLASTYAQRIAEGKEPDNIDKEFLRLWFKNHCDPYNKDVPIPKAPDDLVLELSRRYVLLYEMITGKEFEFQTTNNEQVESIIKEHVLD